MSSKINIAEKIRKYNTYSERIILLKNLFLNKKVTLVGCGPSISKLSPESILQIESDYVITIKQARSIFTNPDFHCYNCNNFTQYAKNKKTVDIAATSERLKKPYNLWKNMRPDIFFQISDNTNIKKSIAYLCDFDNCLINVSNNERRWGPGTLFETSLFLAVHLGFNRIQLAGIDLAPDDFNDNNTSYNHFYNEQEIIGAKGLLVNSENRLVKNAMGKFYEWLQDRNIQMSIVTPNSHLPNNIPRLL